MPDRHIVAVGGGDPSPVLDYVLGLVGERPSLLWVGTAGAEDPWNTLQVLSPREGTTAHRVEPGSETPLPARLL